MSRITGDDFQLIGLHEMAAEVGDGFVPEMMEILKDRREAFDSRTNVVQFPASDLDISTFGMLSASNENNVIAFPVDRRKAIVR